MPTLICDATGDAELLKAIWPQLEEPEPHGWEQLPRPQSVRVFQCVDRTISKWAVAVEGKTREGEGAQDRRRAAAVRGGADEGARVRRAGGRGHRLQVDQGVDREELLRAGLDEAHPLGRAHRHQRPAEGAGAVRDRTAAGATGGGDAADRGAVWRRTSRNGSTSSGEAGADSDRARRRGQQHASWSTCGSTRTRWRSGCGGRSRREPSSRPSGEPERAAEADEPLDIHLWTDVPVPELGPVEPVLWSELDAGLDGLMLAAGSGWNAFRCRQAYNGLFTVEGLKSARERAREVRGFCK